MRKKFLATLIFFIISTSIVFSQNRTVSGTVKNSSDGSTLPGVSIVIKGTSMGVITDINGQYTIEVPSDRNILVFSYVGMETLSVPINGKNIINISLETLSTLVEEVMVVAYGTTKKESFTGSAGVIDSKKIESRPLSNITQAIEGNTTGVQVTSSSGQPGSSPSIRVRGFGTLNGSASPLYIIDGAQTGSIANLNPDDIESMTILKDASSTALYGSRAANGVVLITTKKGRKDNKMNVTLKGSYGIVDQSIPYYETVTPQEYYELMYEALKNSKIYGSSNMDPAEAALEAASDGPDGIFNQLAYNPFNVENGQIIVDDKINPNAKVIYKGLDWYEPLTQIGNRQNYNLTISGGGKDHTYFYSLGYFKEKGYVKKSNFERITSRLNISFNPTERVTIGTNIAGTLRESAFASTADGNTSYANPFFFARTMAPIYPVYLVDSETGDYLLDEVGEKQYDFGEGRPINTGRHIIAEMDYNHNLTKSNSVNNHSFFEFKLLKNLTFTTNVNLSVRNYKISDYENHIVGDGAPDGRYSQDRDTYTSLNWNQLLQYTESFGDIHNIDLLLGHEMLKLDRSSIGGMKTKQIVAGIYEYNQFVTPTNLFGYSSKKRTEGYFTRLNYNYDDKYYISSSFRRDGSSVFKDDVRWGNFYSIGLSWRLSKEEFIENISWINDLKLRASYGEVGNDNIGSYYAYQALYSTHPNGNNSGLYWSTVGNDKLTWESNSSYDAALEFSLFNRKLIGSIEFYKRISDDLLYDMPLPPSMGLNSQSRNVASLYNQGWEIGIEFPLVRAQDIRWNMNIQASTVKNEITSIPDPFINGSKRWDEGHSVYDYYIYEFVGINPDNGESLYQVWEEDENGEMIRKVDENGKMVTSTDYQEAGKGYVGDSSIPDVFGSVGTNFSYKNFDLSILATYSIGGKILDYSYASLMHTGSYGRDLHVDALDAWRKKGDDKGIPRMEANNDDLRVSASTRFLTDASYFALRNINLNYTFDKLLSEKIGLKEFSVFLSADNIFMWTHRKGMNPQQNFSGTTSNVYLPSNSISLGVRANF